MKNPTAIGHALKALDLLSAQRKTLAAAAAEMLASEPDNTTRLDELARLDESLGRAVAVIENSMAHFITAQREGIKL